MNVHRYMTRTILALASAALVMGVHMYAQEGAEQGLQFASKSQGEVAKSSHRGRTGPTGPTGPRGSTGPRGPAGSAATFVVGSAYGSSDTTLTLDAQNIDAPGLTLSLAPLYNGSPMTSSGNPFYFTPYTQSGNSRAGFTVNQAGTYLLQYGLVAEPTNMLAGDLLNSDDSGLFKPKASCWICIQIHHQVGNDTRIGVMPLSLSLTRIANTTPTAADPSAWMLSGSGQIATTLLPNDIVTLQIMLAAPVEAGVSRQLRIGPNNITYPPTTLTTITLGPTLTIMKIAD